MDELSMIVKRVDPDGTLHLSPLGTMYPGHFGLGPVSLLGEEELTCVLSLGSEHTTHESQRIWETKPDGGDKAMDWTNVFVFTGRTAEELASESDAHLCRPNQTHLVERADYIGCYFMDDHTLVTALLDVAQTLQGQRRRPPHDVYVGLTTNEEVGGIGGLLRQPHTARPLCDHGQRRSRHRLRRRRKRHDMRSPTVARLPNAANNELRAAD